MFKYEQGILVPETSQQVSGKQEQGGASAKDITIELCM